VDIAVNITLHALDGEALSDGRLHLANRTTFSQVQIHQSTVLAMNDEITARSAFF